MKLWGLDRRARKAAGERYAGLIKNAIDDFLTKNPEPVTVVMLDETWRFDNGVMGQIGPGMRDHLVDEVSFRLNDIRIDDMANLVPRSGVLEVKMQVRILPYWNAP